MASIRDARPTATDGDATGPRIAPYRDERVDHLPFATAEKSDRYRTERFLGATGLNWYDADPSLQFIVRYHASADELAWAAPHL